MTGADFVLLSLLLAAHYLGDFTPLATPGMRAAKDGQGSVGMMGVHAAVHATLVLLALAAVRVPWPLVLGSAAFELGAHFGVDWGRMKLGLRVPILRDPGQNPFWRLLGLDQLAHGVTLMAIAVWVR